MKKILILIIAIAFLSCEKNDEKVKVTYMVTNAETGFEVNYLKEGLTLTKEFIDVQSEEDVWTHSYEADRGDIVYLSAIYYDGASKLTARVILDQKVYRESSSNQDSTRYITLSGTIPY
jgi:hypothetical protein